MSSATIQQEQSLREWYGDPENLYRQETLVRDSQLRARIAWAWVDLPTHPEATSSAPIAIRPGRPWILEISPDITVKARLKSIGAKTLPCGTLCNVPRTIGGTACKQNKWSVPEKFLDKSVYPFDHSTCSKLAKYCSVSDEVKGRHPGKQHKQCLLLA